MRLWQTVVAILCWAFLLLLVFSLGEITAEPQTAHWIVDPDTGHSEMICR